jgi:hypothetical protein
VAVGVELGVPPAGVPPSLVSMPVSVGVGVGLSEPVGVDVGVVGVVVGVGDVVVGVGVGDEVVGVGVGDVALADGVADTVGDGLGLAADEVAVAHAGDGVGDGGTDGMRSAAVFGAAEVAEAVSAAAVEEASWLVQYAVRVAGQFGEGAGLADAAPLDSVARPCAVP